MEFRVARAAKVTGELLETLVRQALRAQDIPEPDCVICYGVGYSGTKPALNAKCSTLNKMQQGIKLHERLREEALQIILAQDAIMMPGNPPLIGRNIQHSKGRDIRYCRTLRMMNKAIRLGRAYFTPLVDSDTEYRVWVYRKRVLSVYEKRLTEPENNTKFGRNRANGWTFHALGTEEIPESVRMVAKKAVAALNLDFGAVDILGKWEDEAHTTLHATVLEVNSAPGVANEHRSCIVRLTNRIVCWIANGCPARTE
jgi:hypothetical protein